MGGLPQGVDLATPAECRVLINATPLGLKAGDPLPISPASRARAEVALDMVYAAGETAWVRAMYAPGCAAPADGRADAGGAGSRRLRALVSRQAARRSR